MRRAAKIPSPLEAFEQKELVRWLTANRIDFFSVPNEGKRGPALANHMKALGMKHGIPDLIIVTPPPLYPSMRCAVEMKRADGKTRDLTDNQVASHAIFHAHNWHVVVGFGFEHARTQLKELGYGL